MISNELMQGISDFLSFPFTLSADAGVLFTHYGSMLNEMPMTAARTIPPFSMIC